MLLSYYFCVLCTQNIPSLKNAAKVIQEAEENGKSFRLVLMLSSPAGKEFL